MSSETDYDSLPSPPKQSRAGGLQRRKGATTRRYGKRGTKPAPPSAAGPSQPTAGKRRLDSSSSDDDGELSTPSPGGRPALSKRSLPTDAGRKKASTKGKERALEEADADVESEAEGEQTSPIPIKMASLGRWYFEYPRLPCVEMLTRRAHPRLVIAAPQAQEDQDDFGGFGRTGSPLGSEESTVGSGGNQSRRESCHRRFVAWRRSRRPPTRFRPSRHASDNWHESAQERRPDGQVESDAAETWSAAEQGCGVDSGKRTGDGNCIASGWIIEPDRQPLAFRICLARLPRQLGDIHGSAAHPFSRPASFVASDRLSGTPTASASPFDRSPCIRASYDTSRPRSPWVPLNTESTSLAEFVAAASTYGRNGSPISRSAVPRSAEPGSRVAASRETCSLGSLYTSCTRLAALELANRTYEGGFAGLSIHDDRIRRFAFVATRAGDRRRRRRRRQS